MGGMRNALLGACLLLASGAGASMDSPAPKGPRRVTAAELGVAFEGPKDWYVEYKASLKEQDGAWQFRCKTAYLNRYFKETWPIYGLAAFCKDQEPTPKANPTFSAAYVDWPADQPFEKFVQLFRDEQAVVVEEYQHLAGPVDDKLGGRKAVTFAYKGRFSSLENGTSPPMTIQVSLVPLDHGILISTFGGESEKWAELKPILKEIRRSHKIGPQPSHKGRLPFSKGGAGSYAVGRRCRGVHF